MKNHRLKRFTALFLAVVSLVFGSVSCLVPGASLGLEAYAASTSNQFKLGMEFAENAEDSSIIDVIISVNDIQQELYAVEFILDFDEKLVAPVVTEHGEAMDCFMTTKPMYTFVIPGSGGAELQVSRYEQICYYDSVNSLYECRFADLMSYTNAKEGETYNGLIEDRELVITIPFKILDGVADNTDIAFTTSDVKGTTKNGLISVSGIAASGSYIVPEDEVVLPNIKLEYPTLLLESEIIMSVYFSMDQNIDLANVGLLTWSSKPATLSIDTAEAVIPGAVLNANGYYSANTNAIPAKNLGDDIYFCVYAKLDNGTYAYSNQANYSPSRFAYSKIKSTSSSTETKALMVAMLNYGSAAQSYFDYKTHALVNGSLTEDQKALVNPYSSNMMDAVDPANNSKIGPYSNTGGYDSRYPTVSLDGAFSINYYFTTSNVPDGNVTFLYWTEDDYNAVDSLHVSNATGRIVMSGDGSYSAVVEGIAAKDLDKTIYVTAGYMYNGTLYCTGVLRYSIGAYCVAQAASGSAEIKPVAASIGVYCYYAKAYFASI